jgi:c-di-GMP-binding flagellar brake protein YcgR
MEKTMTKERRKHQRVYMMISSQLILRGEPPMEAYSINVSYGGICLYTKQFLPVGTEATIQLFYLDEIGDKSFETLEGTVRRYRPVGQMYGVGIEFKTIDPIAHPILTSLLERSEEIE